MKLNAMLSLGLLAGAVLVTGCGDEKKAPAKDKTEEKKADDKKAEAKPEAKKAEAKPEEKKETKPAKADAGDAMTAKDLLAKFAEDKDAWLDKEVTVVGLYMNSNYVGRGDDKKLNNFTIVISKDDTKDSITCEISDDSKVKDLKQYDEVKVKGKVREFFKKPSLKDCALVDG